VASIETKISDSTDMSRGEMFQEIEEAEEELYSWNKKWLI